jgi:tyrosyl-tRNA synthetase
MNALEDLRQRGFLYQATDEAEIGRVLGAESVTFYVGFDPTGDSLHVGHLLPVMAMRLLQRHGHRPIALVGGGTAMVGDPSGKTEARPILTRAEIEANAEGLRAQLARFLAFGEDGAALVNNADWLAPLNYIEFLRDIGRHFSVNRMLATESVKQRLETGLSFLEFNYALLQAYDFYVLRRDRDCKFQFGGQDQWGNIVAGVDLTRRLLATEVYGATFPLLLKADGEKFGKTAAGAVWLDPERTSPFDYYQFWRNAADADVPRLLAYFTELPMSEVEALGKLEPPTINRAKEVLAYEATCLAHGEDEARKAYLAAGKEFGFADPRCEIPTSSRITEVNVGESSVDIPSHTVSAESASNGIPVLDLFVDAGLCKSKGEARRLIRGGGAYIEDEKIAEETQTIGPADFTEDRLLLRAGKKNRRRILLAP